MVTETRKTPSVSSREVWGHAVANITPSAMAAVTVALVAIHGGAFTWLAYLVTGLLMLGVAWQMGILARHFPSGASLFSYLARGLHPVAGLVAGFSMVLGYGGALLAAPLLGGLFLAEALRILVPLPFFPTENLIALVFTGVSWYLARRGAELSTRWGLWIELFSLACILLLAFWVLWHFGFRDPAQVDWGQWRLRPFLQALVLSLLAYGGFETAGNLVGEARRPQSIPQIMLSSVLLVGGFFVFMAYVETLAFARLGQTLADSNAPLSHIARALGLPELAIASDLAMAAAAFSATIATFNSISRIFAGMAERGVLPAALARRHPRHATPSFALALLAAVVLAGIATVALGHFRVLKLVDIFGTFTGLSFVLLYSLANLAAARCLFRAGSPWGWMSLGLAVLTIPFLLAVLWGSVSPWPGGGVGLAVLAFAATLTGSLILGWFWARKAPKRLLQVLAVDRS
ncbi:MAG: APC family permease [Acidithiobacillus sp.]